MKERTIIWLYFFLIVDYLLLCTKRTLIYMFKLNVPLERLLAILARWDAK
jgi:hypothetical protein